MVKNNIFNKHAFGNVAVILLLVFFLTGGVSAATPISDCTVISLPGEYVFSNDILDRSCTNCISIEKNSWTTMNACINIYSSNVVLDGAGHTFDGINAASTIGVYVHNGSTWLNSELLTNITIKNLTITDWDEGIEFGNTQDAVIVNNTLTMNKYGIYLYMDAMNNTLSGNNVNMNSHDGIYVFQASSNTLSENNVNSNFGNGIVLDGWVSEKNMLIGNNISNNRGNGIYLDYSGSNNILSGNNVNSNTLNGIYLEVSKSNTLKENNVNLNDNNGIYLRQNSHNNILSENNVSWNKNNGVSLYSSGGNNLSGNNINSNTQNGIYLGYNAWFDKGDDNMVAGNNIKSNGNSGINLDGSSKNRIYNNIFNNNVNVIHSDADSNFWSTTKTSKLNIVGGPYIGGNFWGLPGGTGFSQTCNDGDNDGICDSFYNLDASNIDYLPLVGNGIVIPTPTATATPTPTATATPTPTPTPIVGVKGDVSGDGQVSIVDALFIAQYTVGTRTLTSIQLATADVNGDGQVTIVDALFIAQYTVGLRQI